MQIAGLRDRHIWITSILLLVITITISVHKIDHLPSLHIFPSLKIFYGLFFLLCGYLAFFFQKKKSPHIFFLASSPAIPVLIITFFFTGAMHYIFYVFVGMWFIALGTFFIKKINDVRTLSSDVVLDHQLKQNYFITPMIFIVVSVMICFALFGWFRLDKGSFVDEKLWTYGVEQRIEKYWKNIFERDWKNTRPSDKPGVTLAFISGFGLLQTTPSDFYHSYDNGPALAHMLYMMRLPILLFCATMLMVFYYCIFHLFNHRIALLSIIMIGLSPILIGISRLINPDALSWVFMPLTFITYFIYIKYRHRKWLYVSGVLLGLSLLTKYIANIFIIFFILEIFTGYIFTKKDLPQYTYIRNKIIDLGILFFIAIATLYIIFPGTWLIPDRLLLATIWSQAFLPVWKPFLLFIMIFIIDHFVFCSRCTIYVLDQIKKCRTLLFYTIPALFIFTTLAVVLNTSFHMPLTNLELLLAAPKSNSQFTVLAIFASGFYSLIYSISPLVFIGVIYTAYTLFKSKDFDAMVLWHTFLFVVIFYAGSAASLIAPTVRYQIILYPLIFITSAYGWYHLSKKIPYKKSFTLIVAFLILFSLGTLWLVKPFYLSYTNTLLPGEYIVNPKDMGDGSYEMAEYLNALPNSQYMKVWADKNGVCVFFDGYCNSRPHLGQYDENGTDYDYFVISRGSEKRMTELTRQRLENDPDYPLRLDRLYESDAQIYEISPGNRKANYFRIIPGEHVTILEQNDAQQ
jgi:4-amino-4-deoxy-L-arabinose transferase-like glycosyltransferase